MFGPISNGVLAEIKIAQELGKNVRFFAVDSSYSSTEDSIRECCSHDLAMAQESARAIQPLLQISCE